MHFGSARKLLVSTSLAVVALLASLGNARAEYKLTLHESGYSDKTVTFSGPPTPGVPTVLGFGGSFGGFAVVVEVSSSNSNIPGATPTLTISNLQIGGHAGVTQTLQITVSDDNFKLPNGTTTADLKSQLGATLLPSQSAVTYQSFLNGSAGQQLSLSSVGGNSGTDSVSVPSGTFTLKSVTTITITGAGVVQTSGITTATATSSGGPSVVAPEPGTMAAACSVLPFLGAGLWWRRKSRA
jgi:hypothetical protein